MVTLKLNSMRNVILILCTLIVVVGCGENKKRIPNQEAKAQTEKVDTLALVTMLNRYKLKVDSIKHNIDSLERDIYKSAEGGTVQSFYNSSDTLKKEIVYYGETGKRLIHIYFKEKRPVLIEDTSIHYQRPISIDNEVKIESKIINTYYFDKEKHLIYWGKDGKVMPSSQYSEKSKEIIKDNYFITY